MNQVYICADFGSDGAENIKKATRYAGFVYGHDMIPIAPAMYSGALNLSKPKDLHRMGETRKCKLWNGSELCKIRLTRFYIKPHLAGTSGGRPPTFVQIDTYAHL